MAFIGQVGTCSSFRPAMAIFMFTGQINFNKWVTESKLEEGNALFTFAGIVFNKAVSVSNPDVNVYR